MGLVLAILSSLIGTPIFIIICGLALYNFYGVEIDLTIVFIEMYRLAETPTLSAIPLFAISGFLLANSNAPQRLVSFSKALLGWMPGGLAIITVVICSIFTALTGASGMTIVALGGLFLPALLDDRYEKKFSLGLLTTCGSLGLLFPPSLPLILFGIITETPIDSLFLAGIFPGFLLIIAMSLFGVFHSKNKNNEYKLHQQFCVFRLFSEIKNCIWEILLPIVLFIGVFGGFIALSEAASLCLLYVFFVTVLIRREISFRQLPQIFCDSMVLFGAIFIILASAMSYTNFLIDQEVPNRLLLFMQQHIESKWTFLLVLNIFLLAVGCMIDMFSALILVVPLILPVAVSYDINPLHLGIIFLTNLEIGYSTPPVGMNLFISSMRFEQPVFQLYKASLPFLFILLICLLFITYIPEISLFLVDQIK